MKILNNKITFYEDYGNKNKKFFFLTGKQFYTENAVQELELNNGRIYRPNHIYFTRTKEIL